jgi:hypothetical protein
MDLERELARAGYNRLGQAIRGFPSNVEAFDRDHMKSMSLEARRARMNVINLETIAQMERMMRALDIALPRRRPGMPDAEAELAAIEQER